MLFSRVVLFGGAGAGTVSGGCTAISVRIVRLSRDWSLWRPSDSTDSFFFQRSYSVRRKRTGRIQPPSPP